MQAHKEMISYIVPRLLGGLRIQIYNEVLAMQQRLKATVQIGHEVTDTTLEDIEGFLAEKAEEVRDGAQAASLAAVRVLRGGFFPCSPT